MQQQLERTNPFDTHDRDQDDFIDIEEWEDYEYDNDAYEPYDESYGVHYDDDDYDSL